MIKKYNKNINNNNYYNNNNNNNNNNNSQKHGKIFMYPCLLRKPWIPSLLGGFIEKVPLQVTDVWRTPGLTETWWGNAGCSGRRARHMISLGWRAMIYERTKVNRYVPWRRRWWSGLLSQVLCEWWAIFKKVKFLWSSKDHSEWSISCLWKMSRCRRHDHATETMQQKDKRVQQTSHDSFASFVSQPLCCPTFVSQHLYIITFLHRSVHTVSFSALQRLLLYNFYLMIEIKYKTWNALLIHFLLMWLRPSNVFIFSILFKK